MKIQISTSVPSIIRKQADELIKAQYGTMSALLTALISAEYLRHQKSFRALPKLKIVNMETIHFDDLKIKLATGGILTDGYALRITLEHNGKEIVTDVLNLLVTSQQSPDWCIEQCERLAGQLSSNSLYTPGQILRLLKCGFQPLAELGIPTPPQQKFATEEEKLAFFERTGRATMYLTNDLYREWATAYNAWIQDHPSLAKDYGCVPQDENWIPVK